MTEIDPMLLAVVAAKLDGLGLNYAFIGGSIVAFLLDDATLSPVRPTDDLDIIIQVLTVHRYSEVEVKLRSVGFRNDTRQGAPMCRWVFKELTLDIMPTEGAFMGLNTTWFSEALESATTQRIGRYMLRIISPVAFIAMKLAAFADRGNGDVFRSHDLEDLMTVIDGRATIVDEIAAAPEALRNYIASSLRRLNKSSEVQEACPGFLSSDEASQKRLPLLRKKLESIVRLGR